MSYVLLLDWLFFQFWYRLANRYEVLNYHETAFLPARYMISGLVAGAFVYWLYLIPVSIYRRMNRRYWHPRWWLLWFTTATLSSVQVVSIVKSGSPPLEMEVALLILLHLQALHLVMFMIGGDLPRQIRPSIVPGLRVALIFIGLWLFWIGYSFVDEPIGTPQPEVGTGLERYIMSLLLLSLMTFGLLYRQGAESFLLRREYRFIEGLDITLGDLIQGFFSAFTLYFLIVPIGHYLLRGYIIAHSLIFPSQLVGLLPPLIWSFSLMGLMVLLKKPSLSLRVLLWELWLNLRADLSQRLKRYFA